MKLEDRVPIMNDKEIGQLIRNRVFWDLYMLRRYNVAKLLYETILHNGSPEIYENYYNGQTQDKHQVYKTLFSDAYGFQLTDTEALRFRTDVDSFFYSADYARAFLLAAKINEKMRADYGVKWFDTKEAGTLLKTKLLVDGGKLQADELAQLVGYKEVDYEMFEKRMMRRLEIVKELKAE